MNKTIKKVAVLVATGSEEIETITPVDVLRRSGAQCDVVSVSEREVVMSRNVKLVADKLISEVDLGEYDGIVIPGGMPGAVNISNCEKAIKGIGKALRENKKVFSICASPAVVLAKNGLLPCNKATCYPAPEFINLIGKDKYTGCDVEVCGNIVTANGPTSALEFSIKICQEMGLPVNL